MIKAEVHSDDWRAEAQFDATPWFEQATDNEIFGLWKIEWGGDYESDDVARFMEEKDEAVERVFTYLSFDPVMGKDDPVGFECHVNEEDAMAWVEANRPALFARIDEANGSGLYA